MKVSEFIKVLQELPQDMEIVIERESAYGWEGVEPRYYFVEPDPEICKPDGVHSKVVL
jgi:hypothetical protein